MAVNGSLLVVKYLAGDIPGFGAAVGGAFMAAFGAVIGTVVWHRCRTRLIPRREKLRETLHTLDDET